MLVKDVEEERTGSSVYISPILTRTQIHLPECHGNTTTIGVKPSTDFVVKYIFTAIQDSSNRLRL